MRILIAIACVLALTAGASERQSSGLLNVVEGKENIERIGGLGVLALLKTEKGFAVVKKKDAAEWLLLGSVEAGREQTEFELPAIPGGKPGSVLKIDRIDRDAGVVLARLKNAEAAVDFSAMLGIGGPLFRCTNHPPQVHLASGISEMQELRDKHGCSGWKADSSGSTFDLSELSNVKTKPAEG